MPNQPCQRLEWADLRFTIYQISPLRDWADLALKWADLALKWADLGFPMYQTSPRADFALEWADFGFTLCHNSITLIMTHGRTRPFISS